MWNAKLNTEVFGHNQLRCVQRNKRAQFHENNSLPCVECWGGSVTFWGCAAASDTGNIVQVEGRTDSTKY